MMNTHLLIAWRSMYIFTINFGSAHHFSSLLWHPPFSIRNSNLAKKKMGSHFPTNPRHGIRILPTPDDLKTHGDWKILSILTSQSLTKHNHPTRAHECNCWMLPGTPTLLRCRQGFLNVVGSIVNLRCLKNQFKAPPWHVVGVKQKQYTRKHDWWILWPEDLPWHCLGGCHNQN